MKKIYIIQTYSKTLLSIIISKVISNPYSHIMLSLDNSFNEMYGFGRIHTFNPFYGGYVILSKNDLFYKVYRNTKCRIFELNITNKQEYDLKKILKHFNYNKNMYSYDYLGIILRYLNIKYYPKNRYVCSNFISYILDKSNIYHFNKNIYNVTPKDFNKLDNGIIYYEGLLKNI